MTDIGKLITELSEDAAPVKAMPHPAVLFAILSGVAALYLVGLILYGGLRPDLAAKLMSPLFLFEILLLVAMIASSCLSVAVLSFPDMHQKRLAAFAPLITLALFLIILAVEWMETPISTPHPPHGIQCLLCITAYSLVPACAIFLYLRQTANTHPTLAGGVALLAASGIGCLALRLAEPTDSIQHLLQWHYAPMLVLSALGLWLGTIILKWKTGRP